MKFYSSSFISLLLHPPPVVHSTRVIRMASRNQRTPRIKEKKPNDRIAKLSRDAQRDDGTSMKRYLMYDTRRVLLIRNIAFRTIEPKPEWDFIHS
jgi:hypothetical protein